jgi:hypothetical protein
MKDMSVSGSTWETQSRLIIQPQALRWLSTQATEQRSNHASCTYKQYSRLQDYQFRNTTHVILFGTGVRARNQLCYKTWNIHQDEQQSLPWFISHPHHLNFHPPISFKADFQKHFKTKFRMYFLFPSLHIRLNYR